MYSIKNILSLIIFVIFFSIPINSVNSQEKNYYQDIVNDWNKIFPDRNRNAAGPKFFKYIIDKDISYEDFVEYNKLYCAVSGSLISPNAVPEYVYLSENNTGKKICGEYYRCCIPCSCDLMKYSKVKKMNYTFTDGEKEFFVLTISNPCGKDDFPMEVNKNYFCNGKKLDDKQVYVLDDRLVIGLFHNASKCNEQSIAAIDKHEITGQYCAFRNTAPLEEVKGGMGDIFIRLAKDN